MKVLSSIMRKMLEKNSNFEFCKDMIKMGKKSNLEKNKKK